MARNRGRRLAQPFPLPKGAVVCGDLTLDPSQPHNNVLPFPSNLPLDTLSTTFENLQNTQTSGFGAEFGVQLMTFLEAQAHALHLDHVHIVVPQGTRHLVRNSETSFKRACGEPNVRAWLEEHVIDEGRKAAMLVGMYTYCNASYTHIHQNQVKGQVSASDPTTAWSANLGAGIGALNQQTFNVPEEQIFAVEYKLIKFKPWSKKKVEEAKLEEGPNRWKVFFGDRTKGTAAEEEENIFEFNLDDNVDNDDDKEDDNEFEDTDDGEGQDATISMKFEGCNADDV
ncbi:hypothetical protein MMC17_003869 [Xylographa soralifera]|nr:hypothetical protein [Xylographa soralifera]